MKRFFIALAAMAAMVGCSKENTPSEVITVDNFTVDAKIVVDDTRVTVGGEKFTDVKWVLGDQVTLASAAGANATLEATESGDKVRFRGEGTYAADVDTYYAIYPKTTITNGTVTLPLVSQAGNDAAVLVAKSENVAKGVIDMTFTPANALLHVNVTGATAPLEKAEFLSFDGTALPANFTYDFAEMTADTSGTTPAYTITYPKADEGFFFQLPADLDMANGYIVRLTDTNNNICSKAYNGKTFTKGTTTRVDVDFTTPSVTLGAKTSYSYYKAGQSGTANTLANNIIYFDSNYATTYAGIQNAFITEVGFKVDGTKYSSTNGEVTWDKSAKKFYMSNLTDKNEWRGYTVEAYIVTSSHGTISSSQILYITGLPYSYKFDGELDDFRNAGWTTNGSLDYGTMALSKRTRGVVLQNSGNEGFVVSPKFMVPEKNITVQSSIHRSSYFLYWGGTRTRTGYVGPVANNSSKNTSLVSFTCSGGSSTGGTVYGSGEWLKAFDLTNSASYISISSDSGPTPATKTYFFVHEAHFRYAQ